MPVHRPIGEEDWRRHLRGEATLALPLIRAGDVASAAVLDIDLERKLLFENPGRTNELLGRALGAALRLRHELARRGCASLLELSGAKGYHLWLRFDEPVPCFRLRRWLLGLVTAAGPLPEGVRVEVFPKRDRLRPEEVGPVVKLPLGVHGKTGTRCALLDERGKPVADPFEVLRTTPGIPRRILMEAEEEPAEEGTKRPRAGDAAAAAIGPRAQKLLDGCGVLGYLAKKARDTAYLDHTERSTLLCTLGHLGEEGRAALHAVIGHTYNYNPEVTERHVGRLPDFPMSCPKVRERHPEAAAVAPCTCRFQLRGRGYPTPVLYVLKPSEVPAFRKKAVAPAGQSTPASRSRRAEGGPAASAVQREAEALLQKLSELKRHRRGVDSSIARVEGELAALLERAGREELQTRLGLLRRLPAGASGDSDGGENPSRARFVIQV